jgi:hypothetical protein
MSNGELGESRHLSVSQMRNWLSEELRNVLKECELRVREATALTAAYAAGELTPAEAHKRFREYDNRWSEALGGVLASSYRTDEELIGAIDRNNAAQFKGTGWSERQHGRRGPTDPGMSRK